MSLDEIVVRSQLLDALDHLLLSDIGEHDHGYVFDALIAPYGLQYLEAVNSGHHQIKEHQNRPVVFQEIKRLLAVGCLKQFKTLIPELVAQQLA